MDLDDKFEKFSWGNTAGPPKLGRATLPRPLPRCAARRARVLRPLPCLTAKIAPPQLQFLATPLRNTERGVYI
jgi:hypothetical protein